MFSSQSEGLRLITPLEPSAGHCLQLLYPLYCLRICDCLLEILRAEALVMLGELEKCISPVDRIETHQSGNLNSPLLWTRLRYLHSLPT
jgi:hypothetical protein